MQEPTNIHLNACIKVLRYLKGILNYGLFYSYNDNLTPKGYCDADWATLLMIGVYLVCIYARWKENFMALKKINPL